MIKSRILALMGVVLVVVGALSFLNWALMTVKGVRIAGWFGMEGLLALVAGFWLVNYSNALPVERGETDGSKVTLRPEAAGQAPPLAPWRTPGDVARTPRTRPTPGAAAWRNVLGLAVGLSGLALVGVGVVLVLRFAWLSLWLSLSPSIGAGEVLNAHLIGLAAALALAAGLGLMESGARRERESLKLRATEAASLLAADPRPPIVYLRSFKDDEAYGPESRRYLSGGLPWVTQEELLAKAVGRVGPLVAVGNPSEALPDLGAARLYVPDEQWQATVTDLMRRAVLLLFRAGTGPAFWWEVTRAVALVPATRVVFWLPPTAEGGVGPQEAYRVLSARLASLIPCPLPPWTEGARFLCFDRDWSAAHLTLPVRRWWRESLARTVEALVVRAQYPR